MAAHGREHDVVVGVTSPSAGFRAHAWLADLDPDPEPYEALLRLPPPGDGVSRRRAGGRPAAKAASGADVEPAIEHPAEEGADEALSIDALIQPPPDRSLRRLPGLVRESIRLCWRAARREMVRSTGLQLVSGAAVGVQLLLGRRVLAQVLAESGTGRFATVLPAVLLLGAVTAVVAVANLARGEQQRILTELVSRYAVDQVLGVAVAVDLLAYETPTFHNRLQRALVNAEIRPLQIATGVLGLVGAVCALVGIAAALLVLQPLFLLLVVVAYIPAWLVTTRASRVAHDFSIDQTERDRTRLYLRQVLTGKDDAKEVRAFGLHAFLRDRHDRLHQARIDDLRAMVRRRFRLGLVGTLVTSLLTAAAMTTLAWFVTDGRTPLASAATAAVAVVLLGQRLQSLVSSAGALYESSLFVEDFTTFVGSLPALAESRPTAAAPERFSTLSVRDLSFRYPSRPEPSLRGVSIEVNAGEIVALVGPNGSGKTTLAKLLAGLYQPTGGSIAWDGVDASTFDPDDLRRGVAVIFQDFVKYYLSAGENIGMGRHERIDDAAGIALAARQADAHRFLETLKDGYGTRLGPQYAGGLDLSIGQWQRIALARVFFRNSPFIVLDEPTAALDPRGEFELFERIRELAQGRSVLLISHRFSSARSADRIYVLREGEVVEHGTHAELLDRRGLYAELFNLQAEAYGHTDQ